MKKFSSVTAVIPAAGQGSRFDKNQNKLLFIVNKKTIFEHILDKTLKLTQTVIIITSKKNNAEIKKICNLIKYQKTIFKFVIQKESNGMAFAINLATPMIKSKYFFIIWADQLGINYQTMKNSLDNFLLKKEYAILFPTVKKNKPYTLIIKNKTGNVIDVLQSREMNIPKSYGETDCGFFVCNTLIIRSFINKLILNNKIITQKTKEYDFLKSFKYISKKHLISTIPAQNKYESKGINTKRDLFYLIKKLNLK
jgi:bifunctional N-acetylglucosamine-1-phosphate-uridyltransferase/glucosamine-1-phosphate-acetyltransferase GlmU-like protein